MQMIRMLPQIQKSKGQWIKSQSHVVTMISQSAQKRRVVRQPAPGKPYNEPTITVNGQKLKVVDEFTYLGSTLSKAVHIDDEVTARIAFGRLRTNVWEGNGMKPDSKLEVYKSTRLWYCQPSCMHAGPGQYTNAVQKDLNIST